MNDGPLMETSRGWIWAVVAVLVVAAGLFAWFSRRAPEPAVPAEQTPEPVAAAGAEAGAATAPEQTLVVERETDPALLQMIAGLAQAPEQADADEAAAATRRLREALVAAAGEERGGELLGRLREAAIDLCARPPVASGEMGDPDHFFANAVHVARVLGKKRTLSLARDLAALDEDLEPVAAAAYRWLITRSASEDELERRITLPRLYDYATFLLETYGGRSYLLRRLPRQEALASFYALLLVDHARRAGISSHGTDPRPHLPRCRALIESQDLAYRESYLAALDDLR